MEAASHPRYLALDIGSKRIGVAVSDELGLIAQPVLTLVRRANTREDLRSLARLCRRFGVVGVVVGNPLHLSGQPSAQAAKIHTLAIKLGELTKLPIHMWDERLTSHEAHQILYETGHARQDHARLVDQVAAVLILESFLNAQLTEKDACSYVPSSDVPSSDAASSDAASSNALSSEDPCIDAAKT